MTLKSKTENNISVKGKVAQSYDKEMDVTRAQTAFNVDYRDPRNVKQDFKEYIKKYSQIWKANPNLYKAPYISIFQSSGYGKSRLLKEIAHDEYTFYISFATKDSFAYPRRSQIADFILNNIDHCELFFLSCLEQLANHYEKQTPQQFFDSLNRHLEDIMALVGIKKTTKIVKSDPLMTGKLPSLILFAFDEARTLLQGNASAKSPFRKIRDALRSIELINIDNNKIEYGISLESSHISILGLMFLVFLPTLLLK